MKTQLFVITMFICLTYCNGQYTQHDHFTRKSFLQREHDSSSGSKKSNPFTDFLFGIFLFGIAFPVLWFNERRYLINQYRLKHAYKECQVVNSAEVDPNCEGMAITQDIITDHEFAISEHNCIKIKREVEMLQWIQHSHNNDDQPTTYTYSLEWRSHFSSSNSYHHRAGHENDESKWIVPTKTFLAPTVNVGMYLLNESLKEATSNYKKIPLTDSNQDIARTYFNNRWHSAMNLYNVPISEIIILIWDLRVQFLKVPCDQVSIVAQQTQNTFALWKIHDKYEENSSEESRSGCCNDCCRQIKKLESPMSSIEWIYESDETKKSVFQKKMNENNLITTLVRIGGYFLMQQGIGLCLFFSPVTKIISYFPLLGNFLASITGYIFALMSFSIALPFTLITIAIAWLYYRPKVGIALLVLAGGIAAGIYFYIHQHQQLGK